MIIKFNGQELIINEQEINFDIYSPVLIDGQGSVVYDFDIPDDEQKHNAQILKYPQRLSYYERNEGNDEAEINSKGLPMLKGKAFAYFHNDKYKLRISVDNGSFNAKAKKYTLQNIDICDEEFTTESDLITHLNAEVQKEWPDAKYSLFTVFNNRLMPDDMVVKMDFTVADGDFQEGQTVKQEPDVTAEIDSLNQLTTDGSLYLKNIRGNWQINKSVSNEDGVSANITKIYDFIHYNDTINPWDTTNSTFRAGEDGNPTMLVPFFYLAEVLYKIFHFFGYSVDDYFFTSYPDYKKLVIFNLFNANKGVPQHINWNHRRIRSSNHLPRYTVTRFLQEIEKWGLLFFINEKTKTVTLKHRTDLLTSVAQQELKNTKNKKIESINTGGFEFALKQDDKDDWFNDNISSDDDEIIDRIKGSVEAFEFLPDFPEMGEIRYVKNEEKYYQFKDTGSILEWTDSNVDIFNLYTRFYILEGEETRETDVIPVHTTEAVTRNGNTGYKITDWQDITIRVAFDNYDGDPNGEHETANYSLYCKGDNGIGKKWLMPEAAKIKNSKKIKLEKPFTDMKEFINLNIIKKQLIDKYPVIVEKIEGQITQNDNIQSEIEGFTI